MTGMCWDKVKDRQRDRAGTGVTEDTRTRIGKITKTKKKIRTRARDETNGHGQGR